MSGIQMMLLGSENDAVISITDQVLFSFSVAPAQSYYFLTSGGQVEQSYEVGGANPQPLLPTPEQWCTPTDQASNYEAFVTVTSGSLSGGSGTGVWLALSTTRNWYVEELNPTSSNACTFTVDIRRIGSVNVLDTATIDLEATTP